MHRTKCTWHESMTQVSRQRALYWNTEMRGVYSHTCRIEVGLDSVVDLVVASPGSTPVSKVWLGLTLLSTPEQGPQWPKPIKAIPSLLPQ